MRVDLEIVTTEEGVLTGTASWRGRGSSPFHGTLELIALLMDAGDPRGFDNRSDLDG